MPALLGNRGLFCVVGILRGWACLCRDCWFRGSGKASCAASEDCLPRFGAADPDHRGNEFKDGARRADFSGISLKMLLTAETGKKIQLKVASKKQGLCWPQTLSVLARKLIFCLSSLLPVVQALSPAVTGWQPGASTSRPISKKESHCPNIPRVLGSSLIRHLGHMSLSGFMTGKNWWLLLVGGGQISLRFMGCVGEWWRPKQKSEHYLEGDRWKECWMGNQQCSGEGTHPRTPYTPSPRLFQVHSENRQDALWSIYWWH